MTSLSALRVGHSEQFSNQMQKAKILPFGGCGLHNPLSELARERGVPGLWTKAGLKNSPFSLSANTNHQLLDYFVGDLTIPEWMTSLVYWEGCTKTPFDKASAIFTGDVAIIEMSTPTEFVFEGFLLNINRFEEVILASLDSMASERKLIGRWKGALRRANEELRHATAEQIYGMIPRDTPELENVARFVRDTTSRMLTVDSMTEAVASLRDRLKMPVGLILHNYQFMPDGRPVSWPADFKDNSVEVARRLDIPTLDIANYVGTEGVKVLADDSRHWNPSYFARIGSIIEDFGQAIVDGGLGGSSAKTGHRTPSLKQIKASASDHSALHGRDDTKSISLSASDDRRVAKEGVPAASPRSYSFDPGTGTHLPEIDDRIFVIVVLGGPWANGANSDVEDGLVSIEPVHPGMALMFDTGLRSRGREPQAFTDLKERAGGSAKETPCSGIADQIVRNAQARFGRAPQLLFFSAFRGGSSLSGRGLTPDDGFLRGTEQHREVLRLVASARDIAARSGKRVEVAAICLLHGENEVSRNPSESTYRGELSRLQLQYDADLRALTGQTEPVRMYLNQTGRILMRSELEIQQAQLNVAMDNPNVRCVGPVYFVPPEVRPEGGAVLPKSVGYRRIGQLFGRFLLDDMWGPHRDPLRIENIRWIGPKTMRIRYNRAIVLEEDDSLVNVSGLGPGRGLDFNDGASWSPSIESVRVARGRESDLEVELTAPSYGNAKRLFVAAKPTVDGEVGRLNGARSAIRSKDLFDTDPLDGTELFDWACTEVVQLN